MRPLFVIAQDAARPGHPPGRLAAQATRLAAWPPSRRPPPAAARPPPMAFIEKKSMVSEEIKEVIESNLTI